MCSLDLWKVKEPQMPLIVRQMQENFRVKGKKLYFGFVDLQKAKAMHAQSLLVCSNAPRFSIDRVPREVMRWAVRKLGVEEWLVLAVMSMYTGAKAVDGNSSCFEVKVGMHQRSALSPLLFMIVMEAMPREFRVALPWELLYADDLVVIAETEEDLIKRLNDWKDNVKNRDMRVNMNKTTVMISGECQKPLHKAARWPCGVCGRGVGSNSIQCTSCQKWVHKKCSGIKVSVYKVMKSFVCRGGLNPVTSCTCLDIGASASLELVDR